MIDSSDSKTSDLFSTSRKPGRPCTSSDHKRRLDSAERARRYRQNKKSSSPGRIVNTHEVSLSLENENDFLVIYNYANWLSQAVDINDNPSPWFFGSLYKHTTEIMDRVKSIATRANVVWCNPPINRDLWQLDRDSQ